MRKGAFLEKQILALFRAYTLRGCFCLQVHPRRLITGQATEKSPFDFLIYHAGRMTAFDTKECAGTRFPAAPSHQISALDLVNANGGEGFFLVWFSAIRKLVKFRPLQCAKSVSPAEGEETTIDILKLL